MVFRGVNDEDEPVRAYFIELSDQVDRLYILTLFPLCIFLRHAAESTRQSWTARTSQSLCLWSLMKLQCQASKATRSSPALGKDSPTTGALLLSGQAGAMKPLNLASVALHTETKTGRPSAKALNLAALMAQEIPLDVGIKT